MREKPVLLIPFHTLKNFQFYQTGTFKNNEERELYYPLIVYKNGFKLAFLNYTYGTNGLSTKPPTVVNLIDTTLIKNDLNIAKQLNPDAIIVIMHWGLEYKPNESSKQRMLSKKIFDWGADLVVGSHPHVVQPIKKDSVLLNKMELIKKYSQPILLEILFLTKPNQILTAESSLKLIWKKI